MDSTTGPDNDTRMSEIHEKRLMMLKQQTLRHYSRTVKLKRSSFLYFFNLIAIFVLQCIAIYFFKSGFLLSRSVLPNVSEHSDLSSLLSQVPQKSVAFMEKEFNEAVSLNDINIDIFASELQQNVWSQPRFSKCVWIVIDALRFDFVVPINESDPGYNPNYHNNFPALYQMYTEHRENSVLLKFVADPPTTTLQRLKGLTTGSLPTFIDAGSNFDGDELYEDNVIIQNFRNSRNVSLIGDDTWDNLFHPFLNNNLSWPYESLNVWDVHTVDNGVLEHIYPLLEDPVKQKEWQLIVGHFLGMDHVGHRYGPANAEMITKQKQMNDEMEKVISSIDDDTLLVIMGDHGMDETGNHGGDSKLELDSTLFMYSKSPKFSSNFNFFEKEDSKPDQKYMLSDIDNKFQQVTQIDFTPTISLLTGLPVPFNNLGKPINKVFVDQTKSDTENLVDLVKINYVNCLNLQRYKLTLIEKANEHSLKDQKMFERFFDIVNKFQSISHPDTTDTQLKELLDDIMGFQDDSLANFRDIWAKFNNFFIYLGIALMSLSFVIIVLLAKIIPSVVFNQLITEFLTIIVLMTIFSSIIISAIYIVLKPVMFSFATINLLGIAVGIVFGFLIIIFDRYNFAWFWKQFKFFVSDKDSQWSFISLIFLAVMFLSYSSNSFIIFQDSIINFLLINFGLYVSVIFARQYLVSADTNMAYGLVHTVSFILLQKVNSMIRTCREEQSNHCPKMLTNTHGMSGCETTNNFTLISLAALLLCSLVFPIVLSKFLTLASNSYQNIARLWIGSFLKVILVANWIYWCLDYIEFNKDFNKNFFNFSFSFLKNAKLTIARVVIGVCLVGGNFAWSKGPLCIRLVFPKKNKDNVFDNAQLTEEEMQKMSPEEVAEHTGNTQIVGYSNIYGSSYLLLLLNFFAAILITNKPYSSISTMVLVYQILNVLEIIKILNIRNNMLGPILFNLLGYSFFYSTDHQITISSIKWELAFQLTDSIIFPFTHLPVVLNSFGPFILVSLAVTLIVLWNIPPNLKPISLISNIVVNSLTLLMSQTLVTLSSLIFTNFFKRHLMVWKIFVPCFLFNSLILIVVNVMIIFVSFFFGVTKLVHQINRIFGK